MKGKLPALIVSVLNEEAFALSSGQNTTNLVQYSKLTQPEVLELSIDTVHLNVESAV